MTNEEIVAEVLRLLPVGYIPFHKPESIPELVKDWVERAVKAENELERYKDLAEYMYIRVKELRGPIRELGNILTTCDEIVQEYKEITKI